MTLKLKKYTKSGHYVWHHKILNYLLVATQLTLKSNNELQIAEGVRKLVHGLYVINKH